MLIRAADATHVLTGIDLSSLSGALKPSVVITAADLEQIGIRVPEFYAGDLLCPLGKTPLYLGQPVAVLIFEDFDRFDEARLALRDVVVLKFGKWTGPVTMPNYGAFRFTRVAGPTPDAPDVYSPAKNGWVSPRFLENSGRPIWARLPVSTGQAYAEAAAYGEKIRAELAANNPALLVLDSEFETQSVDPMALEPESGLAWYDAGRKNLDLVVSVQSPAEIATAIAYLLGNAQTVFKPAHINTNFASCGGGFGGRDHTPFPLYVALAAMFFPNRPVRLANNRFEQFQSGIKRHAFKIKTQVGVDRATGKIVGFAADHALDGGGLVNFSPSVATVAANGALGIYYVPKVDVTTYVFHSRGVTAGSMRGYGTLQAMTALEVMVDEICAALPLDPIEFRRRNALATGGRILAGNTYSVSIRTPEILDKLERHPIWKQRAKEKARAQLAGILVGTGVACVTKNYGTGADASLGSVEIAPDGRIAIYCDGAEMGNGIGTAVANRVARTWVASLTRSHSSKSISSIRWISWPQASPTPWIRKRRTRRRAIRAGCLRSVQRPPLRAAGMLGHTRQPRPRASCSVLVSGRRRSNCGASRRTIPRPTRGRRCSGKTGNWSCRDWRHSPCRRLPRGRMRAMASPGRWRTASAAGHGRKRPSRWPGRSGRPTSTP